MGIERNVGEAERWASVFAGGLLSLYGLRKRGLVGSLSALAGAAAVYRGLSGQCLFYKALGVNRNDRRGYESHNPDASVPYGTGVRVESVVTVSRPAAELYAFWRRLDSLPNFMRHLEEVEVLSEVRSRWVARAPVGGRVSWEAEINNDVPDRLIGWRSLPGSTLDNAGSVHFEPRADATEVRVVLEYRPPAGALGSSIARLLGEDPQQQIDEDLLAFKQLMERPAAT